jgi:hypothetical protein
MKYTRAEYPVTLIWLITAIHPNKTKQISSKKPFFYYYWEIYPFPEMHSRGNESIPDPEGMIPWDGVHSLGIGIGIPLSSN